MGNSVAAPNSTPAAPVRSGICHSFQIEWQRTGFCVRKAEIQKQAADLRCDCETRIVPGRERKRKATPRNVFALGLCLFNKCTLECKCLRLPAESAARAENWVFALRKETRRSASNCDCSLRRDVLIIGLYYAAPTFPSRSQWSPENSC